jgi:hypothetical protein
MSRTQTKELHDWQRVFAQERIDGAIVLLRNAQYHLHESRCHGMPRHLISSAERMVKMRIDQLWEAQERLPKLKLVESVTP